MKNKTVLARVVNVCSKIVGERQASLSELYESVRCGRAESLLVIVHMSWQDNMNSCLRGDATECQEHGHSVLRIVSSPAP